MPMSAPYRPLRRFVSQRRLVALACTALLAACAALPERTPAPAVKPIGNYASERSFAGADRPWPNDTWWTTYGDKQLDGLIAEALADSPTVAVAQARLRKADALVQVTHAAELPQLGANASASEQKQSYNYLTPRAVTPQGWKDYGRATLDLGWDLDLWGRNRAALAAATSDALAAQADVAQARLLLATTIAAAYAELARQHAALDAARAALAVRAKTADLFRRRYENGLETLGGVRQVDARRASAESDVLALDEQIALQRNRIAALMGAGPDRGLAIARPSVDLSQPVGLPAQLGADLLGRRPDITAARLRVEAAGRRIDQARAAFYPNVNLVAFIGVQSLGLDALTRNGSQIGSVGPAVSLPLFDGGRLRGQLRGADADYAVAVADYDRTVVQALQDVADAATSQRALGGQLARTGEAVDAAREAWRIQTNRYEGGLSTYLDVLSAEDNLLANLRAQSDLQSRSFTLDVALVRALGGGYASN
jgi:NodT family efflux transporter outer membrane factor (OMF) lipoprotein